MYYQNTKRFAKNSYIFSACIVLIMTASGCSTLSEKQAGSHYQLKSRSIEQSPIKSVVNKLYHQHQEWEGVRYRLGGISKNGIDCSGFVYLTFKSKMDIHLPRTTRQQSKMGKVIQKHELNAGDLVFFRTGPTSKHVGIYLEKNKFLHVSQKKGVTISRLDNVYWRAKYWKSVRV
ncbi:lipoprotein Spr/probable lipoprotein NlpC [Nitrosomonas marina]|uniref:Lipoprotein Spr/probable lipoprotein NlpC n=1 Tax=Nitrosomonas marina TaxID=917 RepID=A0A1H9Y1U1_9PROT|nr:NlpC/P60 family protein [Nitrosomonas marina]SES62663.1 lipoprotein Spr/probable lipoprotein NlpC [Nitrosomonas marina]